MGPELVLQLRAAAAVTAGADAAEHLGVGLGLPPPPGRAAASGGGWRRRRGAAAAAGLGGHRGGAARVRGVEPGQRCVVELPWAASPSWVAALYTRREKEDGAGGAES